MIKKQIKYLVSGLMTVLLVGCGSGSSPLEVVAPKAPVDLPPSLPDFQGGQLQFSNGYRIKGTINDVVEPQVTKSGYSIYGGVQ